MLDDLTKDEIAFLNHHGFSEDELYDARWEPGSIWKERAKQLGCVLVLGSGCRKAGHRIRTRANHCAQCDTSRIGHVTRHNLPGFVYIAATIQGGLLKIGNAVDTEQREGKLRYDSYGGFSDWTIIARAKVENRGQTEQSALSSLNSFRTERPYIKDGKQQLARELLCAPLRRVLKSFGEAIKDDRPVQFWKHRELASFDFPLPRTEN